jgi:P-type Cu2+ transporter
MGRGVPLAQAQSDFIVMNNQIASVVMLISQARRTMVVVKQNLFWAFIYNATCVPLAIAGLLPAWLAGLGMAVSSLIVVINALRLSRFTTQMV